jgi:hypothetical protein
MARLAVKPDNGHFASPAALDSITNQAKPGSRSDDSIRSNERQYTSLSPPSGMAAKAPLSKKKYFRLP